LPAARRGPRIRSRRSSAFPIAFGVFIREDRTRRFQHRFRKRNFPTDEPAVAEVDPEIADALREEDAARARAWNFIPSENFRFGSGAGSGGFVLKNKYAEGYPVKRYYGGCEFADRVDAAAIDRAKALFLARSMLTCNRIRARKRMSRLYGGAEPGDTVLGMNLAHGGHLTHGTRSIFPGKCINYSVRREQGNGKRSTTTNWTGWRKSTLQK